MTYGTGAIMAVPAHDTRDYDFAKVFGLPIVEVVAGGDVEKEAFTDCATGTMVNSGFLNGLTVDEGQKAIIEWLEKEGVGEPKVNFKLRDWVSPVSAIGASPFPLFIATNADMLPCPKASCRCVSPRWSPTSPPTTASRPLRKSTAL